jgi:uncharacterized membrane protein
LNFSRLLGFLALLVAVCFIADAVLESVGYNTDAGSVRTGGYLISLIIVAFIAVCYFLARGKKLSAGEKNPGPNRAAWKDRRPRRPKKE